MTNEKLWSLAKKQSKQVKKINNKQAKSRQVVLLCETLKSALKAGLNHG